MFEKISARTICLSTINFVLPFSAAIIVCRHTPFFSVIRFALTDVPHPCIIVNANRRTERTG